jgi:hypothetical protein
MNKWMSELAECGCFGERVKDICVVDLVKKVVIFVLNLFCVSLLLLNLSLQLLDERRLLKWAY